jgi:uncharacterized protein
MNDAIMKTFREERRSLPVRSNAPALRGANVTAGIAILCAAIAVLLGCSLPEGDADPPRAKTGRAATNRLGRETSPYLLAHANNPVDWYPWGAEALEKARKEDKPIFLSIGYSSCHWCHVMEKKVFSDPEIARYMNEHFVNIKVDREERPDLDEIYMTSLQLFYQLIKSPQSGGWPLSMFLTPDGRPLGGGTYLPPQDEEDRTGFSTMARTIVESWRDKRKQMETNADVLAQAVRAASRPKAVLKPVSLDRTQVSAVMKSLAAGYDSEHGGLGFDRRAPDRSKFPVPTKLGLLQYEAKRRGDEQAAKMLAHTLDRMAAGGIHDHIGGGFHRYSTDRYWRVPHFEKMLYDNAQLADIYVEAFRQSGEPHYRAVAEETIEFVLRELSDAQGAFYSALDADSDGGEGAYYAWNEEQLEAALNTEDRAICRVVYGIDGTPGFELGHVLQLVRPLDEAASKLKLSPPDLERRLREIRRKLLVARRERSAPARDDKILTSWNGLMIRALARAGVILERPEYVQRAAQAAEFILSEMRDDKGNLYHSYHSGQARLNAYLDDYAFLVDGLLALHLATSEEKWSNAARRLTDMQLRQFWDDTGKGCYFTSSQHETLLARTKSAYDSVLPSGNSVTVRNLLRLASISKQSEYRDRARDTLNAFVPLMEDSPSGLSNMALALSEYLDTAEPVAGRAGTRRGKVGIAPDAVVLAAGEEEPSEAAAKKEKNKPELVTGQAFLSVDRLPPGGTCKVLVQLQIAEGWHIHANPAGDEFDVATELTLNSELGTELTKINYPAGKEVPREDQPPALEYRGRVNLVGLLDVPADAAGKREVLQLQVVWQACNGAKCLPHKKLKLKIPVVVARPGETVKPANEKLFSTKPPAKR